MRIFWATGVQSSMTDAMPRIEGAAAAMSSGTLARV